MHVSAFLSLLALLGGTSLAAGANDARLVVTQRALVVQCLNGAAVPDGRRSWTVTEPVTLAVTMRNQPRSGISAADSGTAVVQFTPEPGDRYEVEVRSDATRFAVRVWPQGQWTPVVRDRTTDAVVSGPPEWTAPPCSPAQP